MLNRWARPLFWVAFAVTSGLQLVLLLSAEPFVDELFYWLESTRLDWSYTDVPGFVPWLNALMQPLQWLPANLALRLPSFLAALSLPFLAIALARKLKAPADPHLAGLMLCALPLSALIGVLAIADVWLLLFSLAILNVLLVPADRATAPRFIAAGLLCALAMNTHPRFWIIAALALIALWIAWPARGPHRRLLLRVSLPLAVLGLWPVLWFNLQHDFPLLQFQFDDRHPWQFQSTQWLYFPLQALITTPLLFAWCAVLAWRGARHQNPGVRALALLALGHWLFYACAGFFADQMRTSVHWPLLSYVLLLTLTPVLYTPRSRGVWLAWLSAWLCTALALILLIFGSRPDASKGPLASRVLANAGGWHWLQQHTARVQARWALDEVIADQFITLSALAHRRHDTRQLRVSNHTLNQKHGRHAQLQLMGLLQTAPPLEAALLVVEHSALKLQQQPDYYSQMCQSLGGLHWLEQQLTDDGLKVYHFFRTGGGDCELPPLFYLQQTSDGINGWVILTGGRIAGIEVLEAEVAHSALAFDSIGVPAGTSFPVLQAHSSRLHSFQQTTAEHLNSPVRVRLTDAQGREFYSTRYWLD